MNAKDNPAALVAALASLGLLLGPVLIASGWCGLALQVKRFHDRDWIKEAEAKGVLTPEEARALADLRDMVARVIAVDDFAAAELERKPHEETDQKQHIAAE